MNDFVLMDGDEIEVLYTADYEKEPGMSLPYTDVSITGRTPPSSACIPAASWSA